MRGANGTASAPAVEAGLSPRQSPSALDFAPAPAERSLPSESPAELAATPPLQAMQRPTVRGKFLFIGVEKYYVKGVTYGPFATESGRCEYHNEASVDRDFADIAKTGANCVRLYTLPPRWLLDLAQRHGLRVMIGLPWEQHVAFLDNRKHARDIRRRLREAVSACAGHPAILCYAIGNEIPSHIVRWYDPAKIERYLHRLYRICKREDPGALVTYVNYPSTEYLDLPFLDLVCFNVYLESEPKFQDYLARLQNIAGDRPLLMAEIGLDSRRNGEDAQAETIEKQLRRVFNAGCCGAFVFSWTDEWSRGGEAIGDWDFGITRRDRSPKPALDAVKRAFDQVPFAWDLNWPRISVLVCTFNGSRTIAQTLSELLALRYPCFEIIVVDDGSTDRTPDILAAFEHRDRFRVTRTENRGLSAARNTGMEAASGEIVAYIDDDAWPDPHWLHYLASMFLDSRHVGVGGPNIAPDADGFIAHCVAHAPGGPSHVLLTDHQAEHLPGCNMAFRREALISVGGFDPIFRIAGDDVDVCWKLQERGWTLGYHPGAVVWHHRRNSVRAFWKQQRNYGRAEADLERKWPQKYNAVGQATWSGRLYGRSMIRRMGRWGGWRIYHGTWGCAPFQTATERPSHPLWLLPRTPEWWIVVGCLAVAVVLSAVWIPMRAFRPLLVVAVALPTFLAFRDAWSIRREPGRARWTWPGYWALGGLLHLMQPPARMLGRLRQGLTPWRRRGVDGFSFPWQHHFAIWSELWQSHEDRLCQLESALRARGCVVRRGGDFDRWDLELRAGVLGSVRISQVIEEHGHGRQLVRLRAWPRCTTVGMALIVALLIVSGVDAGVASWRGAMLCLIPAWLLAVRSAQECARGMAVVKRLVAAGEMRKLKVHEILSRVESVAPADAFVGDPRFRDDLRGAGILVSTPNGPDST